MAALKRLRLWRGWPSRWPIRWKLAAVSSGLTFVILVAFGLAVGQFTTQQLRENFEAETAAAALSLKQTVQERVQLTPGFLTEEDLLEVLDQASGPAAITLLANGQTIPADKAAVLGPFRSFGVTTVGEYQVATVGLDPVQGQSFPFGVLQYGRPTDRLDRSIGRVWISVLAGTLGATFLAALAGVVLSARAMRPISNLTSAAGEIARTRDPSVTLKDPVADDEVAELTRTLNGMLHELSLARAEREKSLSRQREFIADASHELRTPLTSVLANLELLDDALARSPSLDLERESVESALRSSRRMRRLVADLQILARADSGRNAAHVSCDLSRIAGNAVEEVRPLASNHTIELEADEMVPVSGNPDDLHRVVVNLVDNAARHTPAGSTIKVGVTPTGEGRSAVLTVSDDGPGIPEDLRPQIFDRFVRNAGPGDRSSSNGTGLGLAIVHAIASEHEGTASVGDSDQGGARFTITLPLAPADPEPNR
jgi:two-component system, OmpR family, sensor kinase